MIFRNRKEAGRELAKKLERYARRDDVIVLALPRGGVPVGFEVAQFLGAPLDVFLVRKLGVPGYEELAMGAIATGGVRVLNQSVVSALRVSPETIDQVTAREEEELKRRENLYRGTKDPVAVRGKTVIVVDDGLATGSTMRAAVMALKGLHPAEIVVAAPVAARDTCDSFVNDVDSACISVLTPEHFDGVGRWYLDFSQTNDDEVRQLLAAAHGPLNRQVA
jgi:predicted phosphoribosyltransferase